MALPAVGYVLAVPPWVAAVLLEPAQDAPEPRREAAAASGAVAVPRREAAAALGAVAAPQPAAAASGGVAVLQQEAAWVAAAGPRLEEAAAAWDALGLVRAAVEPRVAA